MKFNKQLAIILVLASMLLSAIAVSFYFYKENRNIIKSKNEMVTIYVAKDTIKPDTLIKEKDLKKTEIARQFILNKPLNKKAIINKYAKERIFANEIFIKEKLSSKLAVKDDEELVPHKYNSYNIKFKRFENPNYALKPNEHIDIVSVYPKNPAAVKRGTSNEYKVQVVGKQLKILGFLRDGHTTLDSIVKKKVTKVIKKKRVTELIEVKADSIMLDIDKRTLLALIADYNKGKQIWMSKTTYKAPEVKKVVDKKPTAKNVKRVKRSYPYRWYQPPQTSSTKSARIEYKDKPSLNTSKSALIVSNYEAECSDKSKLLLGISRKVYLRERPAFGSKILKTVYRNTIIAYTNKVDSNSDWYRTCDGKYVHKNEARVMSYKKIQALMSKKK